MAIASYTRAVASLAATMALAASVSGCGYGVELNGGVFDALGVSSKALAKREETKLAPRPGIVMPPDPTRVPPPSEGDAPIPPTDVAWPVSPEDVKARQQAQLEREQAEICGAAERTKAIDPGAYERAQGPLGSCKPGLGETMFGQARKQQAVQ